MTRHPMDNVQTYAMIQENIALLEQKLQTKIDAMCTWLKQQEEHIVNLDDHLSNLHARSDGLDVRVEAYEKNCAHRKNILGENIVSVQKELSSCIDVKLLYSDRQARETWQQGCEVMIETLHKKVADMDYMLKQSLGCVDNSHADENAKRLGLPTVSHLNKIAKDQLKGTNPKGIVFQECCYLPPDAFDKVIPTLKSGEVHTWQTGKLKIHHPSRKHLEGKLREKNELIAELKATIAFSDIELQKKSNHIEGLECGRNILLRKISDLREKDSEKQIEKLEKQISSLQSRIGHLAEALGCLERENSHLRMGIPAERCDKPCCNKIPCGYP